MRIMKRGAINRSRSCSIRTSASFCKIKNLPGEVMKKLMYGMAVAIFMIPVLGLLSPVYAQFDGDVDLSGILNGGGEGRGGNRGGGNRGPQIPVSADMFK